MLGSHGWTFCLLEVLACRLVNYTVAIDQLLGTLLPEGACGMRGKQRSYDVNLEDIVVRPLLDSRTNSIQMNDSIYAHKCSRVQS